MEQRKCRHCNKPLPQTHYFYCPSRRGSKLTCAEKYERAQWLTFKECSKPLIIKTVFGHGYYNIANEQWQLGHMLDVIRGRK